ncbi:MAG: rRNA maturation RNase YbeY [Dehalococcoidia bacterium]
MGDDLRISTHVDAAFAGRVDVAALEGLARQVVVSEGVPAPAELGLVITDDDTLRDLNRRYRGMNEPTDVLSFGLESAEPFVSPPDGVQRLGEVIVSFPAAERQAREAGYPLEAELAHLVVHGVLHLLGYDHQQPEEAQAMRAREEALLGGAAH